MLKLPAARKPGQKWDRPPDVSIAAEPADLHATTRHGRQALGRPESAIFTLSYLSATGRS